MSLPVGGRELTDIEHRSSDTIETSSTLTKTFPHYSFLIPTRNSPQDELSFRKHYNQVFLFIT